VQVEDVTGERLAARRAAEQQRQLAIGGGESAKMEKPPPYRYVTYTNIFALTFEKVMTRRV